MQSHAKDNSARSKQSFGDGSIPSGQITFTATTAPSTPNLLIFAWRREGKLVWFQFYVEYTSPGSVITEMLIDLSGLGIPALSAQLTDNNIAMSGECDDAEPRSKVFGGTSVAFTWATGVNTGVFRGSAVYPTD